MPNVITTGFVSVLMGAPAADGGMGLALTNVGYIRENTTTLVQEKATKTNFMAEGIPDPVYVKKKKGAMVLAYTIMAPDHAALVRLLGGTITGVAPNQIYNGPSTVPNIIQSVSLIPGDGFSGIDFPKMDVSANVNAGFGDDGLFQVEVELTVLQPDKAGLAPWSVRE